MNYEIVKLEGFSGNMASIYTVQVVGDDSTIFEQFVEKYSDEFSGEIDEILTKIELIGNKRGARPGYFKQREGKPGDHVEALYDNPEKKLRLYCIRHGSMLVVLGGGGPKDVRAWQDDENLKVASLFMQKVSDDIFARQKEGEIWFANNYYDLEGNLIFEDE